MNGVGGEDVGENLGVGCDHSIVHGDGAVDQRALLDVHAGANDGGAGDDGGGVYGGAGIDPERAGEARLRVDGGGGVGDDGLAGAVAMQAVIVGEVFRGAKNGLADGGEVMARAVDERGVSVDGVAAHGHACGEDFGEELFLDVLVALLVNQAERVGFDEVNAGGLEEVGVVGALAGGDGDGCARRAVLCEHGLQIKVVKAGALDGDEGFGTQPLLKIAQAAGGAAGQRVFGIMEGGPGLFGIGKFSGDEFGFAVGADGDLLAGIFLEEVQHVGNEGLFGEGPERPRQSGARDFQPGSQTTGKDNSFHRELPQKCGHRY